MRIITFSRHFPGYHPRKGELTHFPETILNKVLPGWHEDNDDYFNLLLKLNEEKLSTGKLTEENIIDFSLSLHRGIEAEKLHTIRANNRRKQGQFFHPVVWSCRPRHSPQIIFAPPVEIKKVWKFEIKDGLMRIDNTDIVIVEYRELIARHDGLIYQDFKDWFKYPKPFSGQILCFSNDINY